MNGCEEVSREEQLSHTVVCTTTTRASDVHLEEWRHAPGAIGAGAGDCAPVLGAFGACEVDFDLGACAGFFHSSIFAMRSSREGDACAEGEGEGELVM